VRAWQARGQALALDLEGGLQVTLTFEQADRLRVRAAFGSPAPLAEGQPQGFRVQPVAAGLLSAETAGLRVLIHLDPYRLQVFTLQGEPLFAEPASGGLAWLAREGALLGMSQTVATAPGEAFFGFGERFNAFDQRGQALDILVYEEYKNQGRRTYIPAPFFISSRGYGLYLSTSRRAAFDVGASQPEVLTFSVGGPALEYVLFAGPPRDVLQAFTSLVGKPKLPPRWAFGLWMSGNEWNSQAAVLEQVSLAEQHGIPANVMVVEAWSDEATFYIFNDARYAPRPGGDSHRLADFEFPADGRWPDPLGLIEDLHRRGLKLVLWQIPVLKALEAPHPQQDADVGYARQQGLVVKQAQGADYRVRPFWFRGSLVPDFSHPAAARWWRAKRQYLLDELGVDGFKLDGGEHLWGDDLRFADGRTGAEANNLFPNLYQAAYAEMAGPERILLSRSGFTGAQSASTHWAGDENSTFEALRHSITAGLTAGASGFSFWGWDIGGFSGEIPSAELYLRAAAMAAFCPIMQYHSEFNERRRPSRDRTPWNIAARTGRPEVVDVFRFFANLRMNLLPYLWSEAIKSSRSGLPLMRALPLEYPADLAVYGFPYQYLFGESLLVAPVTAEGRQSLDVYLPAGEWFDFWSGEPHAGPKTITCAAPLERLPVFARAGSAVALNLDETGELGSAVGNSLDGYRRLCFRAYPGSAPARFEWCHDPSGEGLVFELGPGGVSVSASRWPYQLTLPNMA
jgi:alpha-glucosidase (family GH31 glycosyl hydrolase)